MWRLRSIIHGREATLTLHECLVVAHHVGVFHLLPDDGQLADYVTHALLSLFVALAPRWIHGVDLYTAPDKGGVQDMLSNYLF